LSIVDALEQSTIDYALGGAIAYSTWAEPRATRDIDLNLWLPTDRLSEAFDVLERSGVTIDRPKAVVDADTRGMFVGRHGEYRVDLFVPSVPFYDEARRRRVRTHLAGRAVWVLSPEVLAVFKLLFFRPKDLADVGRLLEIQGDRFDGAFVRRWLVDMFASDDDRVTAWDGLVRR